ncbi:MAG: hypothetical protein V4569_15330 [Pseudomonadota bacterium]
MTTNPIRPTPPQDAGFEFELTDFASAREALDEAAIDIARQNARPTNPAEWARRRRPASPADRALTGETIAWMLDLPEPIRPEQLAARMPRLANQIADAWNDRLRCTSALHALTVDDRGGRRGLPSDILAEVQILHRHLSGLPSA